MEKIRFETKYSIIRLIGFIGILLYIVKIVINYILENGFSFGFLLLSLLPIFLAYAGFVYCITIYRFYDKKIVIESPFRFSNKSFSYDIIDIKEVLYAKNLRSVDHLKFTFKTGEIKRHYFLNSIFNNNYMDLKSFLKEEEIPFYMYERFKEDTIID